MRKRSIAKRLLGVMAAAALACGLMTATAFAADDVTLTIRCGDSGKTIAVTNDVPANAHSVEVKMTVSCSGKSAASALKDVAFAESGAVAAAKVDESRVAASGSNLEVLVVLSAGSNELFGGKGGTVDLGTLSMKSASGSVKTTVNVDTVQWLDGNYASTTMDNTARMDLTVTEKGIQAASSSKPSKKDGKDDDGDDQGGNGQDGSQGTGIEGGGDGGVIADGQGQGDGEQADGEDADDADKDSKEGASRQFDRADKPDATKKEAPRELPVGFIIAGVLVGLALIAAIVGIVMYVGRRKV